MASPQNDGVRPVNEVAVIRTVFPKHTSKMLATCMGIPIGTAREWIYRHLSSARRRELALALLAELDEQDKLRAGAREHLRKIVGDKCDG